MGVRGYRRLGRMEEGIDLRDPEAGGGPRRQKGHRHRQRRRDTLCSEAELLARGSEGEVRHGGRGTLQRAQAAWEQSTLEPTPGCAGAAGRAPRGRRGKHLPTAESRSESGRAGGGQPGGPDLGLHVGSHALGGPDDHVGDPVSQAGRAPGVPLPHPAGRRWVRAGGRQVGGARKWWAQQAGGAISGGPGPRRTSRPAPRGPACRRSPRPRGSAPW